MNKSSVVPTHGTFVPRPRGFGALWEWVAVSRVLLESRLPRVASLDIHGARVRGRRDALRRGLVLSELLWQTRSMNPRSSTDSQDSALVLGVLREILSGTVTPERFAAFKVACTRLSQSEYTARCVNAFSGPWPRCDFMAWHGLLGRLGDSLFFLVMGAFVAYAVLVASGGWYRGKPDLADTIRWRHIMQERRVAGLGGDSTATKKEDAGEVPASCCVIS